ncbi:hypothetical protein JCM16303_001051 [Sporobolomyces ruberrimus]
MATPEALDLPLLHSAEPSTHLVKGLSVTKIGLFSASLDARALLTSHQDDLKKKLATAGIEALRKVSIHPLLASMSLAHRVRPHLEKIQLVLLDGRHRCTALAEVAEKATSESPLPPVFVEIYDASIWTDKVILEELVMGDNRDHSLASVPCDPTLRSHLVRVNEVRNGKPTGAPVVVSDKGNLRTSFFTYTSSQARTEIAIEATQYELFSQILQKMDASPQAACFSAFGAATPFLFLLARSTFEMFHTFDPAVSMITLDVYPYLSHVVALESLGNPLYIGIDNDALYDEDELPEARLEQCSDFGKSLRSFLTDKVKIDAGGRFLMGVFHTAFKGVKNVKSVTFPKAKEVVSRLKEFADALTDKDRFREVIKGMKTRRFDKKLLLASDLAAITGTPTRLTRTISLVDSLILVPLAETLAALLQLAHNNDSLHPSPQDPFDPEPFLYTLVNPQAGFEYITKRRPRTQVQEPWTTHHVFTVAWQMALTKMGHDREEILRECINAKARADACSELEKSTLLNLILPLDLQSTPQAEVIRRNVHLIPFILHPDRSLVQIGTIHDSNPDAFLLVKRTNLFFCRFFGTTLLSSVSLPAKHLHPRETSSFSGLFESWKAMDSDEHPPTGLADLLNQVLNGEGDFKGINYTSLAEQLFTQAALLYVATPAPAQQNEEDPGQRNLRARKEKHSEEQGSEGTIPGGEVGEGSHGKKNKGEGDGEGGQKRKKREGKGKEKGTKRRTGGKKRAGSTQAEAQEKNDGEEEDEEDVTESDDGEEEGPTKQGSKKPRLVAFPSDASILIMDELFGDDAASPADWSSTTILRDQATFEAAVTLVASQTSSLEWIAFNAFRHAHVYAPFGPTIDPTTFVARDFRRTFDSWFDERKDFNNDFLLPSTSVDDSLPACVPVVLSVRQHIASRFANFRLDPQQEPSFEFWRAVASYCKGEVQ